MLCFVASRTGHLLLIPIYLKPTRIKAIGRACLPVRIRPHRTDHTHPVLSLTLHHVLNINITTVYNVLFRQQSLLFKFLQDWFTGFHIWNYCAGRLNLRDQMNLVLITGLGEMHLVTNPLDRALIAIMRLRIIR